MKKMLSGLLMLAMFLSLSLAGWSAPALAEAPADRAGSYVIEELYMDGEDYTEAMKTQGFTVTLVLNEDGTARMESSNMDDTLTFRWDEAYFIYDSGEKTPYEYQDGVIRMEEDNTVMVFRKLSGDAEAAGEPEEPADITGTWVGTLDMREMLVESAADLAPYLKMAPVFVTLEMEGDGSYTLQVDASPAMDAMKDALRDYLKAFCAENNLTEEQFAASTGMTVDEAVESSMKDVDMSGAMQSGSGRYLEKDGAVVWDPGANAIHGLFTGDYLSFSVEPFGDVLLSRQKLDGVWMARVDMRDILVEETPELEDYLGSANMNVYLVLKDDGSYELTADGSSLIPAFREAAYKYLETMCEENGKSIDDLQELTGMDAETMLDALIADMDLEETSDTFEGSYTQRDGALVLDPGQNETEGSYDGMLLTMEIEEEKLIFTRSSFLGTWNGYLDVTEIFTEGDEELEGYLENVKIGVTLQLNADGSYTVSLNPRPMLTSLHSGLRAYLEDGAKEQNVTLEELEASLGMSLDEYIDSFLAELGADQLALEESGSYTVKNGSIRFPEDASAFVSGVWFGTTMVVTMEDVGDAVLTRR